MLTDFIRAKMLQPAVASFIFTPPFVNTKRCTELMTKIASCRYIKWFQLVTATRLEYGAFDCMLLPCHVRVSE